MEEETARASTSPTLEENLYRESGYASLNGIAVRAGVRGVSSSRLLESHARPGLSARGPAQSQERTAPGATPASRAATLRAQDRDFRGNGSSGLGCCAPRRLTATTAAWPATRWAQSETPRLFPPPCRC